jgi:sec-independent protein translocase protein TatA
MILVHLILICLGTLALQLGREKIESMQRCNLLHTWNHRLTQFKNLGADVMGLGNIGASGLLLILIVLLFVFGPSKLPEIGKSFGKSLREFRSAARGILDEPENITTKSQVPNQQLTLLQTEDEQDVSVKKDEKINGQATAKE